MSPFVVTDVLLSVNRVQGDRGAAVSRSRPALYHGGAVGPGRGGVKELGAT